MIYQKHPQHGLHIAYNTLEAEFNNSKGWETVTEEEFYSEHRKPLKVTEDKEIEGLIPRSVLVDLYIDKFGKKPHHRMNDDSIKAALDADHT